MHLYDSLARTREELALALAKDGAILVLDLNQFEVVVTSGGINIQLRSIDPSLHIAIPASALRILLPHQVHFPPSPPSAVSFAVADHLSVGGTSN